MNTSSSLTLRTRRSKFRRIAAAVSAVALGLSGVLVSSGPAHAALFGPFNIDGSVPDAGTTQLADAFGSAKELGPKNASTTKIGVIQNALPPMLDLTNPNAQVDLRNGWLDLKRQANNDFVYFAWERDSNSGSGFIAYEFMHNAAPAACNYTDTAANLIAGCNPWKNRTAGDFLILWDQQGGSTDLYKRVWSGTAPNLTLGAPEALGSTIARAQYSADGFRGEAAVNLTAAGLTTGADCTTFANVIPSTVTGNSDTADYKDTILQNLAPISPCSATVVTTPKQGDGSAIIGGVLSIGTGILGVKDSAVVNLNGGTATAAGSVAFFLCKLDSGTCTSGGTSVGSTSLSAYGVPLLSPTAYVTSAGRYCWRAVFSGDAANNIGSTSDSADTECFTVNPKQATLSTTAGVDKTLGQAVTDDAVLGATATRPTNPVISTTNTAGAAAGGNIVFKLYGPSDTGCGALVYTSGPVPVSGNGTYNASFTPTSPGNYHWVATYSGDSPNTTGLTHNVACDDTAEDVTVNTVASSLTSAQEWVPNDSVTVSAPAGGNLAGSVTFELFANGTCTGANIYTVTRTVAGASDQTVRTANTTAQLATGSFSWKVSYDSTNDAQRDIAATCHETSSLTVTNNGTISSGP